MYWTRCCQNGISETKMSATIATRTPGRHQRKTIWVAAGLAVVLVAGGVALWKDVSDPPKPWLVRWRVSRFLKKQSERSDFKIDFQFPTRAEMAKAPPKKDKPADAVTKGQLTGKDFDTLKAEYISLESAVLGLERKVIRQQSDLIAKKAQLESVSKDLADAEGRADATNVSFLQSKSTFLRERVAAMEAKIADQPELKTKVAALAPIIDDLWAFQRTWLAEAEASGANGVNRLASASTSLMGDIRQQLDDAASYVEIYKLIGQELWVAERLFSSANPEHRRVGLSLALQASQNAQDTAQNGWLAGRICEGYIWSNLDAADDRNRRSAGSLENLLTECAAIFRHSDEWPNVSRCYELLLAKASTTQAADSARAQIAVAHEQSGDIKGALHYLREIKATNDFRGVLRRIPRLERQLR